MFLRPCLVAAVTVGLSGCFTDIPVEGDPGTLGGACPCDPDDVTLYCNDDDVCADVRDSDTYFPNVTAAIGEPCVGDEDGITALVGAPYDHDSSEFVDATFGSSFDIEMSQEIDPISETDCRYTSFVPHLVINLPQRAWQLRRFDTDEVRVVFEYLSEGEEILTEPRDGFVELTGYDPDTLTLCGEVSALFSDGANTRITGTFAARGICGTPE